MRAGDKNCLNAMAYRPRLKICILLTFRRYGSSRIALHGINEGSPPYNCRRTNSGLDLELAVKAMEDFRAFANEGKGVLLITHDIELALRVADRVAVFKDGTVVEETSVANFASPDLLQHPFSRALWHALPEHDFAVKLKYKKETKYEYIELQNVSFSYDNSKSLRKNSLLLMVNLQEISPSITISRFLKSRFFLHLISRLNHMNVLLYKLLFGVSENHYMSFIGGVFETLGRCEKCF